MGDRARAFLMRSTTPGERFDLGLQLVDTAMRAVVARAVVPEDATPEERARIGFRALREAQKA